MSRRRSRLRSKFRLATASLAGVLCAFFAFEISPQCDTIRMVRDLKSVEKDMASAASRGDLKSLCELHLYKGEILLESGAEDATEEYLEALRLSQHLSPEDRMLAHRKLGECYILTSQYEAALPHLKTYLDLATSEGSLVEQQRAWTTLGRCLHAQADTNPGVRKRAEDAYMKSLQLAERLRDALTAREFAEMKGRALYNIALVKGGDVAQMLQSALYLFKKYDLKEDLCRCFEHLAETNLAKGDGQSAIVHCDRWIEAAKGAPERLSRAYVARGKACLHADDWEAARTAFKRAYYVRTQPRLKRKAARLLKMATTIRRCKAALKCARDGEERSKLYEETADAFSKCGFHKWALGHYLLAIEAGTAARIEGKRLGDLHASVAATYRDTGELEAALRCYEKELSFREDDPVEAGKTKLIVARTLMEKSSPPVEEACRTLREAADLFRRAGDERSLEACLEDLRSLEEESKLPDSEDDGSVSDDEDSGEISECSEEEGTKASRPRRRRIEAKVNWKGETPLHLAVIEGSLKKVEALLKAGHSVEVRDNAGWQPLHEAANFGFLEIARCLVEAGKADVNDPGGPKCEGVTPLHDAVQNGNLEVALYLLEKGASVNARTHLGKTPSDCLAIWKKRQGTDLEDDKKEMLEELERKLGRLTETLGGDSRVGGANSGIEDLGDAVVATALVDEDADDWCVDDVRKRKPRPSVRGEVSVSTREDVAASIGGEVAISRKRGSSSGQGSRNRNKVRRQREEPREEVDGEVSDEASRSGTEAVRASDAVMMAVASLPSSPATKSLRIRIRDKLLLVPVPSGEGKNVGWLANEASERYFHLVGIRPLLNVLLEDGAVVDPSDPLECIADSSALIGEVVSWRVPPSSERYSRACEKAGVTPYPSLTPVLEDCEVRGVLELRFARLDRLDLVLEALRHQENLHTIDLGGTKLNSASVRVLSSCVETLGRSLRTLCLRCVGLTPELLEMLADSRGAPGVVHVDLSYNRLGGDGGKSLEAFLMLCPNLKGLDVAGCGLSDWGGWLGRLAVLERLDASDNPLSESAARALASSLKSGPLRSLDLSHSLSSVGALGSLFFTSTCGLREVGLRGCDLGDAEADLLRAVLPRGSLARLDLTGNPGLSREALKKLSEELAGVCIGTDEP